MVTALVLSGGTGTRLGSDIPKQYIKINDTPVIIYCLESLMKHERIDAVQIVAATEWQDTICDWLSHYNLLNKFKGFSLPGDTRQLSIFNGLNDIREYSADTDMIFIHDAARPFLSEQMITECIVAMEGHDGVLPVLPMKDTVYFSNDGNAVDSLLDRSKIYAGQAPEIFNIGKYFLANQCLLPDDIYRINGSTEPAIMAGMDIVMIPGDEKNFKITTKADLERFVQIISDRGDV